MWNFAQPPTSAQIVCGRIGADAAAGAPAIQRMRRRKLRRDNDLPPMGGLHPGPRPGRTPPA
jgi:hypothetical protein